MEKQGPGKLCSLYQFFSRNKESVELLTACVLAQTFAERTEEPPVGMQTQRGKQAELGTSIINCFSYEGNSTQILQLKWHAPHREHQHSRLIENRG